MERLRGPINSFFFGEKMSSECLEQAAMASASSALEMGYTQVSFLQMLNGVTQSAAEQETEQGEEEEDKQQLHFQIHQRFQCESNLQLLLEIQNCCNLMNPTPKIEPFRPTAEQQLESCITHACEPKSVVPIKSTTAVNVGPKGRKKRKRSRAPRETTKNEQEVESQRMNHITVERNRRRLMNSHYKTLRALMPSSFVPRGDQASSVAGAIDFVKELEQLLFSLQAKKRMRAGGDATAAATSPSASSSCASEEEGCHVAPAMQFFVSPQYTGYSNGGGSGVDVEAAVVQGHVNLKVVGPRRRGQLVRAVAAAEEIGLCVLHLNVTSLDACSVLYSMSLKIKEECKLGSGDEIAKVVHQIFS